MRLAGRGSCRNVDNAGLSGIELPISLEDTEGVLSRVHSVRTSDNQLSYQMGDGGGVRLGDPEQ